MILISVPLQTDNITAMYLDWCNPLGQVNFNLVALYSGAAITLTSRTINVQYNFLINIFYSASPAKRSHAEAQAARFVGPLKHGMLFV